MILSSDQAKIKSLPDLVIWGNPLDLDSEEVAIVIEESFLPTFIPAYFPYDVEVNRKGASPFKKSIASVKIGEPIKTEADVTRLSKDIMIVDAQPEKNTRKGIYPNL